MHIAVVGGFGVGLSMRVPEFPVPGETVTGSEFVEGHGGKGSNQAVGAARLGAEVSILTALGDDARARMAEELWDREGVRYDHVARAPSPTMVGFIMVNAAGENEIAIAPGALAELSERDAERFRPAIEAADVLVASMEVSTEAVLASLRIARELGTRTILNPAPMVPLPRRVWDWVDVLTPNRSEAATLVGRHDLSAEDLARAAYELTRTTVVMTNGEHGCIIDDGARQRVVPAFAPAQIVDTTGAGDTFNAALAVSLAQGATIDEAARFANAAGSIAVGRAGVIDALPAPAEIQAILRA